MIGYLFLTIVVLSLVAFFVGRASGRRFIQADGAAVHSLPSYHGAYVAIWVGIPALILVLLWMLFQNGMVDALIWRSLPETVTAGADPSHRRLILSEIQNVAAGRIFTEPTPEIAAAAERVNGWRAIIRIALFVAALATMLAGLFFARSRLAPRFRARNGVERFLDGFMLFCASWRS